MVSHQQKESGARREGWEVPHPLPFSLPAHFGEERTHFKHPRRFCHWPPGVGPMVV